MTGGAAAAHSISIAAASGVFTVAIVSLVVIVWLITRDRK